MIFRSERVKAEITTTADDILKKIILLLKKRGSQMISLPLRKHAYSNILKISLQKTESFQIKKF